MDDVDELFDELTRSARHGLDGATAAENPETRREQLGVAVRALTRLWAEMNPEFDGDAYYPVSWLVGRHWSAIVAGRNGAEVVSASWPDGGEARHASVDFSSEIGALCADLAGEPLFGARELLHSNMLAWFIDAEPSVSNVFAAWSRREIGIPAARTQREKYSFDLIVQTSDRAPVVVENKVFSAVDPEQLERYTPVALKHLNPEPVFVLLSLIDPGWDSDQAIFGGRAWQRRSYGELGAALQLAAEHLSGEDSTYRQETLRRYGGVLMTLDSLALKVTSIVPGDPFLLPDDWVADLEAVRLRTAFSKLRSQRMAQLLAGAGVDGVSGDVSRGEPLLEQFWDVPDSDGDTIGWQVQGRQWRLAVRVGAEPNGRGRSKEHRAMRERYVEERYADYFRFDSIAGPLVAKDHEGWRAFSPDFVYRYRLLDPTTTVDDLSHLAREARRAANSYLSAS